DYYCSACDSSLSAVLF
nr:immunoglobulin light chain junction region [Macaca mulatta]